jgi:Ser/Thr protein kinase RdoA (MazF antagonist)
MTHQEKTLNAIHKIFPEAVIESVVKFSKGLTSNVFKVEIRNPDKTLVIKFFPKKIESKVEKSAKISSYLKENNLPSPQTYDIIKNEEEGSVVMDYMPGNVASEVWETASKEKQSTILVHSGEMLKKIHNLEIPPFWVHQKHEITSQKEWIEWINIRIKKYLEAVQENVSKEIFDFLSIKFKRLQDLYENHPSFRFVPLHWDYHLSNINVDENGEMSGVFDFDNAMKGHDMADLGQTVYWLIMEQKISDLKMFENLFNGYGNLSEIDKEFVYLHFLLFLAGVMRSTWPKDNLKWLNEIHLEMLENCVKGEYLFY